MEKVCRQSIKCYDSSHCIIQKKYCYSNKYYENEKSIVKSVKYFWRTILPRLRNHNATDDVDFKSFWKILHSKLGKLM